MFFRRKTITSLIKLTVKQTATILLMAILAFNWAGYRVLSGFMEEQADQELVSKLDRQQYDESSLIELRVPLNAPYLNRSSSSGFERIDGELNVNGVLYKYVKRKVENGELVLLCIPNENKTKIQNSRAEFFKLVNDLNQSSEGKSKNTASYKSFVTEYRQENNSWHIAAIQAVSSVTSASIVLFANDGFHSIPEQPPRA